MLVVFEPPFLGLIEFDFLNFFVLNNPKIVKGKGYCVDNKLKQLNCIKNNENYD